jgi:hypothetical protein
MLTEIEKDDIMRELIKQVDAFSVYWLETVRCMYAIVENDYDRLEFRVIEDADSITLEECDDREF